MAMSEIDGTVETDGDFMEKPLVLVIDDEPLMVKSTCMALKFHGFEAMGAASGPLGLETAGRQRPQVILLDIMMPEMDGWQVLSLLKDDKSLCSIPVVIFTAREYSNGNTMAESRGAADYLAKPFELTELVSVVKRHLSRAEA
jgi:DNA-binding response OmpR family regulator